MMNYHRRQSGGYSLIEVLVAITILLLAVAGPLTIASKGLQSSYYARDQVTANMLAQEGIEAVIAIRNQVVLGEFDSGSPNLAASNLWQWTSTAPLDDCFDPDGCNIDVVDSDPSDDVTACNSTGSNCVLDLNTGANRGWYSVGGGTASPFQRVIRLQEVGTDQEVLISSRVTWTPVIFGGAPRTVELSTSIFNYYATP